MFCTYWPYYRRKLNQFWDVFHKQHCVLINLELDHVVSRLSKTLFDSVRKNYRVSTAHQTRQFTSGPIALPRCGSELYSALRIATNDIDQDGSMLRGLYRRGLWANVRSSINCGVYWGIKKCCFSFRILQLISEFREIRRGRRMFRWFRFRRFPIRTLLARLLFCGHYVNQLRIKCSSRKLKAEWSSQRKLDLLFFHSVSRHFNPEAFRISLAEYYIFQCMFQPRYHLYLAIF